MHTRLAVCAFFSSINLGASVLRWNEVFSPVLDYVEANFVEYFDAENIVHEGEHKILVCHTAL